MLCRSRPYRSFDSVVRSLAFALLLVAPLAAAGAPIPVLEDASVYSQNPAGNYGTTSFDGGLFTGTDCCGMETRFYLKFSLPVFVSNTQIVSATLKRHLQRGADSRCGAST